MDAKEGPRRARAMIGVAFPARRPKKSTLALYSPSSPSRTLPPLPTPVLIKCYVVTLDLLVHGTHSHSVSRSFTSCRFNAM